MTLSCGLNFHAHNQPSFNLITSEVMEFKMNHGGALRSEVCSMILCQEYAGRKLASSSTKQRFGSMVLNHSKNTFDEDAGMKALNL